MYTHYIPKHSNFIMHWTGRDIDERYDATWTENHSSRTDERVTALYLKRLKSILKHGLWMTTDMKEDSLKINESLISRPRVSRTCFTELKLSDIRSHACGYGRLGIGFKRPFLFRRYGAPMIYYHHAHKHSWLAPPFKDSTTINSDKDYYLCFLKHMNEKSEDGTQVFRYYDESEWRIIYSKSIESEFGLESIKMFSDFSEGEKVEIIGDSTIEPDYLISVLDEWMAMIIYPSLDVKIAAEDDSEICEMLLNIKPSTSERFYKDGELYRSPKPYEKYNKIIQMDLDSCRSL